ncbi:unnamed protein product [Meloidogyne enterolobii]|uniref:Uncharacterized protein n=1 Tax=Meloidogyne enterolobii TaxID=390850 RepID=A0ACB1AEA1_MELEN
MRSSTLFLLAVVLLAVIVQLHADPKTGQKAATTEKEGGGKPATQKVVSKQNKGKQTSNKIHEAKKGAQHAIHGAKKAAQHVKDSASKLAHGNKPNDKVIEDDKLKTEVKNVLVEMSQHPEEIKKSNKKNFVKAVTCQVCKKINQDGNPKPKDQKLSKSEKKKVKKENKEKMKKLNAQIKKLLNSDETLKKEMDELFNAVQEAHKKNKAAALPKTNSGPKNAQAKPGHLNVKQAHELHGAKHAAVSPLKKLVGLKANMPKTLEFLSGGKHASEPKSAETPQKHSPIKFETLRRNVSSPVPRGNVGNMLRNSSIPSVSGPLASNMFGGKGKFSKKPIGNNGLETSGSKLSPPLKLAEDDDDDFDDSPDDDGLDNDSLGDDDEDDLSNSPLDKAESDEDDKDASEEDKTEESDEEDFKENKLNSNLLKKAEYNDLLSKGNEDLDEELKKKAFNEKVREATELALKVGDEIQKNVPKVNSAPQVKNSLFDQIGNQIPVKPVA